MLQDILKNDPSILFVTGAGVSAESGIPTYRGVGGMYTDADTSEDGMTIEEVMSGRTWQTQPEITWKYLRLMSDNCRGIQPNLAHKFIAEMERRLSRVWVLTQNVDGLHHNAGSKNVIAIHGDAQHVECLGCEWETRTDNYRTLSDYDSGVPVCPECGGTIRPHVVLFGESLPDREVALYDREIENGQFDIVVSVGTTHTFHYIDAPFFKGALNIQINPLEVPVIPMFGLDAADVIDHRYLMGACEAFTQIAGEIGIDVETL